MLICAIHTRIALFETTLRKESFKNSRRRVVCSGENPVSNKQHMLIDRKWGHHPIFTTEIVGGVAELSYISYRDAYWQNACNSRICYNMLSSSQIAALSILYSICIQNTKILFNGSTAWTIELHFWIIQPVTKPGLVVIWEILHYSNLIPSDGGVLLITSNLNNNLNYAATINISNTRKLLYVAYF